MTLQIDPSLTQILTTLSPEDHLGVLLAAQVGGTPQEVQIILQTTAYDEEREALKTLGQYIIRAIGVKEHRLSVGLFNTMILRDDNPLLYPHNWPMMEVYFQGKPANIDDLMLGINQLYGQTYGRYDPFRRMADELNTLQPLATLLNSGGGLLGTMPQPFAARMKSYLERLGLEVNLIEVAQGHHHHEGGEAEESHHQHHPPIKYQLLVMDDSYFIAQMFSADPMGG